MARETTSKLVRMAERLTKSPHSVETPLAANMESAVRDLLSLMRLRLQEGGLSVPDAVHYLGERLVITQGQPGTRIKIFINAALAAQPDVFKSLLPHFGVNIGTPKSADEDLFIRDILAAKRGELSESYIDSRINGYLFSDKREMAA